MSYEARCGFHSYTHCARTVSAKGSSLAVGRGVATGAGAVAARAGALSTATPSAAISRAVTSMGGGVRTKLEFVRPQRVSLLDDPELDEKWVQERIAENASILGLGDLVLRDRERAQPHAGKLDLLLQDPETNRRYEVEVQLGRTDESHVIRTLEYWDIERKRYPQYDHCAVLVAEDISARFLNVISLFNGTIPLVAIQMQAFKLDGKLALIFTTVLDEMTRGLVDEDEEVWEPADREYWANRATQETVAIADNVLELIKKYDPGLELKYNKFYIGLAKNGRPNNFVVFRPQKRHLNLEVGLPQTDETEKLLGDAGVDLLPYDQKWEKYRIRLTAKEVDRNRDLIDQLVHQAHERSRSQR